MKKTLFLLLIIAVVACKEEPKVDYAVISGKITNKDLGEVTINSSDRTFKEAIEIAEDGSFTDTLQTDITSYVLFDGKNPVFLHIKPGYNLNISYDVKDFENSLSIAGIGSEINNYLVAKQKKEKASFGIPKEFYSLNEADYKSKINEIIDAQETLLNNLDGIPDDYKTKEKRNLKYFYLNRLNDYEGAHKYFTKDSEFKVSDDFLSELEGMDYNNEADFIFSNDYKNLVIKHYRSEADKLAEKDSLENDIAFLKIAGSVSNETIKNSLLFDHASYSMSYSKDLEAYYHSFMSSSTNEKNNASITEKYNKMTALTKGNPSPKFVNYENYKGGTMSLDDLKGKYVYIDVWATWCGPCKREIPFLKEVEEKYHDKNIEFVSLSIDRISDHEKWKAMIEDKELGGTQLFADNDWNSSFVKDYQIEGIPRFILIDTEGNIVDSNAPRPSSPELIDLFTELNI